MSEKLTAKMESMIQVLETERTWDAYNSEILGKINPGSMDHTLWTSLGILLEHENVPDNIKEKIVGVMASHIIATEGTLDTVEAKLKDLNERVGRSSVCKNDAVIHSLETVAEVVKQAKDFGAKKRFAGKKAGPVSPSAAAARKAYGK